MMWSPTLAQGQGIFQLQLWSLRRATVDIQPEMLQLIEEQKGNRVENVDGIPKR